MSKIFVIQKTTFRDSTYRTSTVVESYYNSKEMAEEILRSTGYKKQLKHDSWFKKNGNISHYVVVHEMVPYLEKE